MVVSSVVLVVGGAGSGTRGRWVSSSPPDLATITTIATMMTRTAAAAIPGIFTRLLGCHPVAPTGRAEGRTRGLLPDHLVRTALLGGPPEAPAHRAGRDGVVARS